MEENVRERNGAIWLPIVDVDFALGVYKDPRTAELLIGARRQVVVKVVQMLEKAKRNQIDGQVRVDVKDVGLVLLAGALTVEFLAGLSRELFDDDEQT